MYLTPKMPSIVKPCQAMLLEAGWIGPSGCTPTSLQEPSHAVRPAQGWRSSPWHWGCVTGGPGKRAWLGVRAMARMGASTRSDTCMRPTSVRLQNKLSSRNRKPISGGIANRRVGVHAPALLWPARQADADPARCPTCHTATPRGCKADTRGRLGRHALALPRTHRFGASASMYSRANLAAGRAAIVGHVPPTTPAVRRWPPATWSARRARGLLRVYPNSGCQTLSCAKVQTPRNYIPHWPPCGYQSLSPYSVQLADGRSNRASKATPACCMS